MTTLAHNFRYTLAVNQDGTEDTRFPNGDKPVSGPTIAIDSAAYAAIVGSLQNLPVGSPVSFNLRSCITGVGAAGATLSLNTVSGTDAVAAGWAVSGSSLTNAAVSPSAGGVLDVVATDSLGNAVNFPQSVWSIVAAAGADSMAPNSPTGLTLTGPPGAIVGNFDAAIDNYDGSNAPTGLDHYNVYASGAKVSPPSPLLPPAGSVLKAPQLTASSIGAFSPAPSATQSKQQWTLAAAGVGLATLEEGEFVGAQFSGDASIAVKVDAFTSASAFAFAGLMIRESLAQGAVFVALGLFPNPNGIQARLRATTGGAPVNMANLAGINGPVWLRLDRTGSSVTCLYSTDGGTWKVLVALQQSLAQLCYLGMYASSQQAGSVATAVFHEVNTAVRPVVNFSIPTNVPLSVSVTAVDVAGNESPQSLAVIQAPPPLTPVVTAVSGTAYQGTSSITGSGFSAGVITVTLGGVKQSVVVNSDSSISIPSLARSDGVTQCGYGPQNVVVTSSLSGSSGPFSITFAPQAGGQFVALGTLDATLANRISAVPDYAPGDLLAGFGATGTGTFTLFPDGSFAYDTTVTGFTVEVFSSALQQWGTAGFQTTA